MEVAGVILAVPAVVQQLLKVCVAGYDVFTGAQSVGIDIRNRLHDLDVSKQIFEDWVRDLARHNDNLNDVIQPNSQRYKLILLDLSLIARVFTEVEQLENKYGISRISQATGDDNLKVEVKVETEDKVRVKEGSTKVSYRSALHKARFVFKKSKSKSIHSVHKETKADASLSTGAKAAPLSSTSSVVGPSTPLNFDSVVPNEIDLGTRASDIELFKKQMSLEAEHYQKIIPTLKRYQWAYNSGEQLNSLISDLQKYVKHLRALTEYPMKWSQSAPALVLPAPFYEFKVGKQLPYPRLHTFRGREYLIQDVQDSLMSSNIGDGARYKRAVIVLRGMGGIGKSQVALEYIYRNLESYSAVFWVDGTSQSTANESGRQILQTLIAHYSTKYHSEHALADVATDLGIPGQLKIDGTLSDEVVKKPWPAIKRWMAREGNWRWCLVIDGLNVPEDISTMEEVLPPCDYGHIIVTSRIAVRECKIIEVELLDKASSLSLLLGGQVENAAEEVKEAAKATAQKLGYLPLALSQAAAYVVNCALDYVEYLSRLTRNMARYIGETISKKYANGVFSCWQLSVETLMQSMPQSIELLRLCSFLSPSGVSKELLDRGLRAMGCFEDDHFRFEEAMDLLVQYSLMKRITSNGARTEQVYWMHPLVRLWAEETYLDGDSIVLERDPKRLKSIFTQGALNAVSLVGCSLNPRSEPRETNEWAYERRNMTHITLCLDTYMQECTTVAGEAATTIKVAVALANFGWYKFYWDEEHASAEITKLSIKLFDRLLRENPSQELRLHRFITQEQLLSNYIAGELLGNDPEDLEKIVNEMISEGERMVELTHSFRQSLQCMRGAILVIQQRHEEARTALEICVEENETLLAPGDAESMAAIHWLARTYWGVGDTETAQSLFRQALALNMEYQGPNHRETLNQLWWLSECRRLLGDLQGQLEYLKRAAEASEAMYGLANRNTMDYLAELVKCYRQDGQDDEAEAVMARMDEAELAIARMDEAGWVIKDAGTLPD